MLSCTLALSHTLSLPLNAPTPRVEKYRPAELSDLVSHADIISTSAWQAPPLSLSLCYGRSAMQRTAERPCTYCAALLGPSLSHRALRSSAHS